MVLRGDYRLQFENSYDTISYETKLTMKNEGMQLYAEI